MFEKKSRVRCICLHLPSVTVGRHRLQKKTNCNQKKKRSIKKSYELISNSTQTCPSTMCLKMNAIVFVDLDGHALQLVLLIRGVNDFSSRQRLQNQIEVSQALFLLALFRARHHCPWYLFFSSGVRICVWSSFASSFPLFALVFCPSDCEL